MNNRSPKVSIVLPVYNGARYLKQSIDSCLNQTYKNIELIIIDDGSTDETSQIIKSVTDTRVKSMRLEKNVGLPSALNAGFRNSEGEYLTWTSHDNQYLPISIEEMLSFLARNENADLVYTDYWAYYVDTGVKELRRLSDNPNLSKCDGIGACFLYTRRVYDEIGDYDPRYRLVEDYDYWIRVCKKFKAVHFAKPLYVYGEHSKSLTNSKYNEIFVLALIVKYKYHYLSLPRILLFLTLRFIWSIKASQMKYFLMGLWKIIIRIPTLARRFPFTGKVIE